MISAAKKNFLTHLTQDFSHKKGLCCRKSKTKFKKTARQLFRSNVALASKKGFIGKAFDLRGRIIKYA
jgi:hypothetical protein